MPIRVTPNQGFATTTARRIRARLAIVAPHAQVAVAVPVASLSHVELHVSLKLDTTGQYRFISQAALVLDSVAWSLDKQWVDELALMDFHAVALQRPLDDGVALVDAIYRVVSFSRSFSDALLLSDEYAWALSKAIAEIALVAESQAISSVKHLTDDVEMVDLADLAESITCQVAKTLTNAVVAGDTNTFDVDKVLGDLALVSDLIAMAFSRPLIDVMSAADDSRVELIKATGDAISLASACVRVIDKVLSETLVAADHHRLQLNKLLTNVAPVLDAVVTESKLARVDSAGVDDSSVRSPIKVMLDSVYGDDASSYSLDALRRDVASPYDFSVWAAVKAQRDSVDTSDNVDRLLIYQRQFADAFGLNDSADASDGITYQAVKSISNAIAPVDSMAHMAALGKADSAALADTGLLVCQGYCDLSYFAEDYTGVTRAF